jgi:putative transposase
LSTSSADASPINSAKDSVNTTNLLLRERGGSLIPRPSELRTYYRYNCLHTDWGTGPPLVITGKLSIMYSPELFLSEFSPESLAQDMKLNRQKIHGIIRKKQEGMSTREIAKDIDISSRRVDQIWKYFRDHGHEPIIGNCVGRPRKPYNEVEAQLVREAYLRFRFGAIMLEVVLKKMYNVAIPHNRIHMYLLAQGFSFQDPKKQKRRKWVRYEREHSMSPGHIDWHEDERTGMMVCAILADASRKV